MVLLRFGFVLQASSDFYFAIDCLRDQKDSTEIIIRNHHSGIFKKKYAKIYTISLALCMSVHSSRFKIREYPNYVNLFIVKFSFKRDE